MAWVKLYDNGLQKRIFSIIFAIFYAAAKFATYVVSPVKTLLKLEFILVQLSSFRVIWAYLSSFCLIWAYLGLFHPISA